MGLTLIEAAKYETRLEHLAVIKTFAEGELLSWLPFMNIAGGGLFYSVEKELPSVGFRAVNEGYKQSYGVVDPSQKPCTCSVATWMWTARSLTCKGLRPVLLRPR